MCVCVCVCVCVFVRSELRKKDLRSALFSRCTNLARDQRANADGKRQEDHGDNHNVHGHSNVPGVAHVVDLSVQIGRAALELCWWICLRVCLVMFCVCFNVEIKFSTYAIVVETDGPDQQANKHQQAFQKKKKKKKKRKKEDVSIQKNK